MFRGGASVWARTHHSWHSLTKCFVRMKLQRLPASRDDCCLLPGSTNGQQERRRKTTNVVRVHFAWAMGTECVEVPSFCGRRSIASRWRPHRRARFKDLRRPPTPHPFSDKAAESAESASRFEDRGPRRVAPLRSAAAPTECGNSNSFRR